MKYKVDTKLIWNNKTRKEILQAPNKMLYACARKLLDITIPNIPLSKRKNSGHLRLSSVNAGVRGDNGDYYIGSYTDYAVYPYNMKEGTHWSEPGTYQQWYDRNWKEKGNVIIEQAVKEYELK